MTTQREARDCLADALAAFLRGEITSIDERISDVASSKERLLRDAYHLVWTTYDDLEDHRVSASPEEWQRMLSLLAWLRSGYGLRWRPGQLTRKVWHWPLALGILAALSLAWLRLPLEWFILTWLAAGTAWVVTNTRRRAYPHTEDAVYEPFLSREDWHAHRHLLDDDRLPAYQPGLHDRPIRSRWAIALMHVHWGIWGMIFLPLWVLFSLWPWWHTSYRRTEE